MTDIQAHVRFLPQSAQKVRRDRYSAWQERHRSAGNPQVCEQARRRPVYKLVASAVANAEENFGVSRDDLFVAKITADEAPTRKWRRFGARGRFKPLLRRSSHITVILRERGA
jgi:large subunit ribosomal protein L22